MRIGPEIAGATSQEGGQIELVGTDSATAYVTDIRTATAGDSLTSSYRIRPVGDHTSGGIRIGGQGGGNSQPSIIMYTGVSGSARFKIDSAGIVKGLWNNNGTSNSDAQFRVVSTMPTTPDANIIYFVV